MTNKQIYDLNNMNVAAQNVQLGTLLDSVATTDSPELTGTPTAPTANTSTNTTQIATTAFVHSVVSSELGEIETALHNINTTLGGML